jgi:hypothetical protein
MADWVKWLRNVVLPSAHDERVEGIKAEVEDIKQDVTRLKDQVEALEAFRDLAKDSER